VKWYIGKSRHGKSKMMEHEIRRLILERQPVCVIDPHGELYDDLVDWFVWMDIKNVVLLDPTEDTGFRFNPLPDTNAVGFLVRAVSHIFSEESGTLKRVEKLLRMIFYALSEQKRPFTDARKFLNPAIRCDRPIREEYYRDLWEQWNEKSATSYASMMEPIESRFMKFFGNPFLSRIFSSVEGINFFDILDDSIFLVNLHVHSSRKSNLDDEDQRMLGILLINTLFYYVRLRGKRWTLPLHVFIDEFYLFLTEDINNIFDQGSKFGIELYLANQRLEQLDRNTISALISRADEMYVFRIQEAEDAVRIAKTIYPHYSGEDLQWRAQFLRGLQKRQYVHFISETNTVTFTEKTLDVYKCPNRVSMVRAYKNAVYAPLAGEVITSELSALEEPKKGKNETVEEDDFLE